MAEVTDGRLAQGRDDRRALGAAPDRTARRGRGTGAPHGHRRERRPAGGPRRRRTSAPWPSSAPAAAAETVALTTRAKLQDARRRRGRAGGTARQGAPAYRAGYLAEDRRQLEKALRWGDLLGLATTNALELGVDVSGLDAVLIAGWPGTRASLWQQAGRAGRDGQDALAVLIARDDPLDTYLVHHPEALFGRPSRRSCSTPTTRTSSGPHLCAAAAEIPLTEDDLRALRPDATGSVLADLVAAGLLSRRAAGWFWTSRERATDLADIRGGGGAPGPGRGDVDRPPARHRGRALGPHDRPHRRRLRPPGRDVPGASLDLEAGVALVERREPDYTTFARDITEISVLESLRSHAAGARQTCTSARWRSPARSSPTSSAALQTGEILGDEPLDLPPRTLRTRAVWWTLPASAVAALAEDGLDLGGAAHAAEHAVHRPAAAVRHLRPLGHRRRLHRAPRRHRAAHRLRLRRPRRRRRLRRTRLRPRPRLAHRHPRGHRLLRVRTRLPLLHPVPQVRQRQRTPGQGRSPPPPRRPALSRPTRGMIEAGHVQCIRHFGHPKARDDGVPYCSHGPRTPRVLPRDRDTGAPSGTCWKRSRLPPRAVTPCRFLNQEGRARKTTASAGIGSRGREMSSWSAARSRPFSRRTHHFCSDPFLSRRNRRCEQARRVRPP